MKSLFQRPTSPFHLPRSAFRLLQSPFAISVLTSTFFVLTFTPPLTAQPRLSNAQRTTRVLPAPFAGSFDALTKSITDVAWVGYAVPSPVREGTSCCFHSGEGATWIMGCALEPGTRTFKPSQPANAGGPIKLEGSDTAYILFRVEQGQIERVRTFSEGCELDAGGRIVIWLETVVPAESVALLGSLVRSSPAPGKLANGALSALAMHAAPESTTALLDLAREHAVPRVRGEAIFWLAQRAGEKAAGAIAGRVDDDPDLEVKRRAVFALSTLPKDEGIPLLITIARTHEHPAIRRQAFFWLGQSKDPRALEFFAEILR